MHTESFRHIEASSNSQFMEDENNQSELLRNTLGKVLERVIV
jgi:hypothetical protein